MMYADMRVTGEEVDGVPVLEVNIGEHPGDQGDQGTDQSPPQEVEAPPEEEQMCRYCMIPEAGGSLVAPCECRGSLERCHMECLQRWYQQKRSMTCELCRQPYHEVIRAELVEEAARRDREALQRQQEEAARREQEEHRRQLEGRTRGVRRPRSLEDDDEEPSPQRRRLDEGRRFIIEDDEDDEGPEGSGWTTGDDDPVLDPTFDPSNGVEDTSRRQTWRGSRYEP